MKHLLHGLAMLLLLPFFPEESHAQNGADPVQLQQAKQLRQASGTVLSGKIHLLAAHRQIASGQTVSALIHSEELKLQFDESRFLFLNNEVVGVSLQTTSQDSLIPLLEDIGFQLTGTAGQYGIIEGFIPVNRLLELDNLSGKGLKSAGLIYRPVNNTGSVTSQADEALHAARVRATGPNNWDGSGISIGVLSDSYDDQNGAGAGVSSGDLPNNVTVIQDLNNNGSDEGRAMIELIHDLAPGADKYFATAFFGQTGFAANIQALADAGCSVIVDDIVYFAEPFFQDGILAQKIDSITQFQDVIYFSSAGNRSTQAYESTNVTFSVDPVFSQDAYDFDQTAGADHFQQFTLANNEDIRLSFQWDEPWFASVASDLDIYIYDDPPTTVQASSTADNIANDQPVEIVQFTNNSGSSQTYNIYIHLYAGPAPGRLKYVNFGDHNIDEYDTASPTVNPHAAGTKCVAVAAAPYLDQSPESFTSHGPSTFLFDADGTRKPSPEVRQTPDFTASDGTNTTFFGNDIGCDSDTDPNFFGTSAAAPHAAAVAALIRQANPGFNRDVVYNAMFNTAKDIYNSGFDNVTGQGLINAYDAIFSSGLPASLDITEGFESGYLSDNWAITSADQGRILVTGDNGPNSGSYHLTMDTWCGISSTGSLNEAILHFDATGHNNIMLTFDQKEFGDEDHPMPASFTGSSNTDGVALSVDGVNWYQIITLTGSNSTGIYQTHSFNLSTIASNNALTLGADVRIKFQQFDNFPIASGPDGFAFDNISITGTMVLPITLMNFSAEKTGEQQVLLQWATRTEAGNDFFTLERSADGQSFFPLATIDGAGFSTQPLSYEYLDRAPLPGKNFYRLRQTDFDGTSSYSKMAVVEIASPGSNIIIAPNPVADGRLHFWVEQPIFQPATVGIYDMTGRLCHSQKLAASSGRMKIEMALPDLSKGMYFLRLTGGQINMQRKFLVK